MKCSHFTTPNYATFLWVDFFALVPNPLVRGKTSNPAWALGEKKIQKWSTVGYSNSETSHCSGYPGRIVLNYSRRFQILNTNTTLVVWTGRVGG